MYACKDLRFFCVHAFDYENVLGFKSKANKFTKRDRTNLNSSECSTCENFPIFFLLTLQILGISNSKISTSLSRFSVWHTKKPLQSIRNLNRAIILQQSDTNRDQFCAISQIRIASYVMSSLLNAHKLTEKLTVE